MLVHKPAGTGHPFAIEIDQRFPVVPMEGSSIRLGASVVGNTGGVSLEYRVNSGSSNFVDMLQSRVSSGSINSSGGHLSEAQANSVRASEGWLAEIGPFEFGSMIEYRFSDGDMTTSWFLTSIYGWRSTDSEVLAASKNHERPVAILTDGRQIKKARYELQLSAGEKVSGFGERFEATEFSGRAVTSVLFEQYKNQGAEERTYMPMNFAHVLGGKGWGFWIDTFRRVDYSVNESDSLRLIAECEVDVAFGSESDLPAIHIFTGAPHEVLKQFLRQVGEPVELPEWIFGLWASSNEWNTQEEVEKQAKLHLENDIPIANLVIEAWSDESTFTTWRDARLISDKPKSSYDLSDFTFPEEGAWPDPKGMVDMLHSQGVKLHLWQIPLLKTEEIATEQLAKDIEEAKIGSRLIREPNEQGGLVPYKNRGWWFPGALMPDLTDNETAQWWAEKRRYLVRDIGVDGFKTDGGEHAWGNELVYLDGGSGADKNWRFPVFYAKTFGDLLRSEGKAPVTFSRAGNIGSQAHGAFWAGDENSTWEAFRWSLNAGLTASACGIYYWGWDIGGFSGEVPSSELYLRSAAAACFVPIMQYHSEFNHHRVPNRDRTPWNIADRNGDPSVVADFRKIVKLRESLRPYIAQNIREALTTGKPLMRPLYFDFQDVELWSSSHQWLFGKDLLVAPIVREGMSDREVYLPRGCNWVNCLDNQTYEGGQTITAKAARHQPLVFAKADSIDWTREVNWSLVLD